MPCQALWLVDLASDPKHLSNPGILDEGLRLGFDLV